MPLKIPMYAKCLVMVSMAPSGFSFGYRQVMVILVPRLVVMVFEFLDMLGW